MSLGEIVLAGRHVRLEPLRPTHAPGVLQAGGAPEVWRHMASAPMATLADAERFIQSALAMAADGTSHPFAIIDLASGRFAGSTRYMDLRAPHSGLEIGWTWLGADFQRTAVNTECKLLLLGHAFEVLRMERVQLKTDILNTQSQRAIERLGAVREGVLRAHMRRRDGTMRDTVMYSILCAEWPAVRTRLEAKLA